MRERLPLRLREGPYTAAVSGAMAGLSQQLLEAAYGVADQFAVSTATWGLPAWEELVGITPGAGADLEERRMAVVSKLCSSGTANAEMIRRLAQSLTGYQAEVTENFGDYSFSLRFYGEEAGFIHVDLDLLDATVEEIKPAHLRLVVEKITWGDLEHAGLSWAQLEERFPSWEALENARYCHKKE